jgi:predicted RNA-binding protein
MCESTVYIEKDGNEEVFMKEVAKIDIADDKYICRDILGNEQVLEGVRIKDINLVGHKIVFARK